MSEGYGFVAEPESGLELGIVGFLESAALH